MINKLINNYKLIIYILLVALIASLLPKIIYIGNAKVFDHYYVYLMIISVCISSVLFSGKSYFSFLKTILLTGITCGIVSSVVFSILDKSSVYFTFEMEGYAWSGKYGFLLIFLILLIAAIMSLILWRLKLLVLKLIQKN